MATTTAVFIPVRLGSTRLPGKALLDIEGKPAIAHLLERMKAASVPQTIVLCTTVEDSDDPLEEIASQHGVMLFRGSIEDLLDRYLRAAEQYDVDAIVNVDGDDLLVDPEQVDEVAAALIESNADLVRYEGLPFGGAPLGIGVPALRKVCELKNETSTATGWLRYFTDPGIFKVEVLNAADELRHPEIRMTLDYPEDYEFFKAVFGELYRDGRQPRLRDVIRLVLDRPDIARINSGLEEKYWAHFESAAASTHGQRLYAKARAIIPGGTQLLSKRPEMFLPDQWPSYYSKAKGAEVTDLDGVTYVDMGYCGIGACVLGFADPDVDAAVRSAIDAGTMSTLNCPEEVELAELLCELHPWADMVRYARCGGEAMAVAVRIARAKSGRDKVAFCGYHGWHDWYLAANLGSGDVLDGHLLPGLEPAGVPRGLAGTALPFHYNRIDELEAIVSDHADELAAIVMEPVRSREPEAHFLEGVRRIATEAGVVLVFDEVTSGFRMNTGGIHLLYGVEPDIAVFAKAIGNGYPMAAIVGTDDVMQAAQTSFISSTYWTEKIGPVAALATIRKHRDRDVPRHLTDIGERVQAGWSEAAGKAGLKIGIDGIPPLGHFSFDYDNGQEIRTLFTQMMLERGFLATNAFYAMYAHRRSHVDAYLAAIGEVFGAIFEAIEKGQVQSLLKGPVAHSGFRRLT